MSAGYKVSASEEDFGVGVVRGGTGMHAGVVVDF